jgi:hypothetical protein
MIGHCDARLRGHSLSHGHDAGLDDVEFVLFKCFALLGQYTDDPRSVRSFL